MFSLAPAIPSRSDLDWCWYLRRQGREGEALERVLHNIGVMHPGGWADWAPSTMTRTGAPVEMHLTEESKGLSLLTEVADPDSDPTSRVGRACQIMTDLGGTPPVHGLRDVISAAQGAGALRFGAWLGLRQRGRSLQSRLFAEVPADATDLTSLLGSPDIGQTIDACGPGTRATLLALDGTTGQSTVYFNTQRPNRSMLALLAAQAQVSDTLLAIALARLADRPQDDSLPIRHLGFSFAMQGAGVPPVLSLHVAAARLCGTDDQTSARLMACCAAPIPGYASLLDALPAGSKPQNHHRVITLTARPGAAPRLSVGVAAPWSCPFELW